jgi:hypothetical protein
MVTSAATTATFRDSLNLTESAPLLSSSGYSETLDTTRCKSFGSLAGSILNGDRFVNGFGGFGHILHHIVMREGATP